MNTLAREAAGVWERIHRPWQLIVFEGKGGESARKDPGVVCLFVEEKLLWKGENASLILPHRLLNTSRESFQEGWLIPRNS